MRRWETLKKQEKPIRFLITRLLLKFKLCRFFKIETQGYLIHFHPSTLSASLWYNPNVRHRDTEFLYSYLKKNDIAVDIGANVGTTVIAAAKAVGECGKVFAFEPHPKIFSFLESNLKLNNIGNVQFYNTALGSKIGYLQFSDIKEDDQNKVTEHQKGLRVPVSKLDEYINNEDNISLIKIDVEGYEKFVLEGARQTIKKTDCIYIEISERHFNLYGYSSKEVLRILEDSGFRVFKITKQGLLSEIDSKYVQNVHHENVLALRNIGRFFERTGWHIIEN